MGGAVAHREEAPAFGVQIGLRDLLKLVEETVVQAGAQSYPSKPITLLVPAAAGGPTDTVARLIAESMGRTLGQTILVENQGGAGGTLGMGRIAKTAPDGYTIAVWHIAHATAPALYENLKYSPLDDFDHMKQLAMRQNVHA